MFAGYGFRAPEYGRDDFKRGGDEFAAARQEALAKLGDQRCTIEIRAYPQGCAGPASSAGRGTSSSAILASNRARSSSLAEGSRNV